MLFTWADAITSRQRRQLQNLAVGGVVCSTLQAKLQLHPVGLFHAVVRHWEQWMLPTSRRDRAVDKHNPVAIAITGSSCGPAYRVYVAEAAVSIHVIHLLVVGRYPICFTPFCSQCLWLCAATPSLPHPTPPHPLYEFYCDHPSRDRHATAEKELLAPIYGFNKFRRCI